jgi:hypothetical protein
VNILLENLNVMECHPPGSMDETAGIWGTQLILGNSTLEPFFSAKSCSAPGILRRIDPDLTTNMDQFDATIFGTCPKGDDWDWGKKT